jgi:dTDP-4-dehydrorhamnose reductase
MKVLIIGGTGHLGSALRERAPTGVEIAFAHYRHPAGGSIPFNLEQPGDLPRSDLVIGAFPLAKQLMELSAADAELLVERYIQILKGACLIQLSSDAVFSGDRGLRAETDIADAISSYGKAQAGLDAALLRRTRPLLIRTSFIFGWAGGRYDKRLAPMASGALRAADQRWPSNVFRSPTEVNFLAEGIWRAAASSSCGVLNIAGPRCSIAEFFGRALSALGPFDAPPPFEEVETTIARDTSLRTDRMETELNLKAGDVWQWHRRFLPQGRCDEAMVDSALDGSKTPYPNWPVETPS